MSFFLHFFTLDCVHFSFSRIRCAFFNFIHTWQIYVLDSEKLLSHSSFVQDLFHTNIDIFSIWLVKWSSQPWFSTGIWWWLMRIFPTKKCRSSVKLIRYEKHDIGLIGSVWWENVWSYRSHIKIFAYKRRICHWKSISNNWYCLFRTCSDTRISPRPRLKQIQKKLDHVYVAAVSWKDAYFFFWKE